MSCMERAPMMLQAFMLAEHGRKTVTSKRVHLRYKVMIMLIWQTNNKSGWNQDCHYVSTSR